MVWRRSSAMGDFLEHLAQLFQTLPPQLLRLDRPLAGNRDVAPPVLRAIKGGAVANASDSD